jgi:hypothetical protein
VRFRVSDGNLVFDVDGDEKATDQYVHALFDAMAHAVTH